MLAYLCECLQGGAILAHSYLPPPEKVSFFSPQYHRWDRRGPIPGVRCNAVPTQGGGACHPRDRDPLRHCNQEGTLVPTAFHRNSFLRGLLKKSGQKHFLGGVSQEDIQSFFSSWSPGAEVDIAHYCFCSVFLYGLVS